MADQFTEVIEESFFQRIMSSIRSVIFGLALFCASFVLLWKNEGCAVAKQHALAELRSNVVKADVNQPVAANDEKPVLLNGTLYSKNYVFDDQFITKQPYLKLSREVEMFQWVESVDSESKKNLGGSKKTTKTYRYEKKWSRGSNSSQGFKEPGHDNPKALIADATLKANQITFGTYDGDSVLEHLSGGDKIPLLESQLSPQIQSLKSSINKPVVKVVDGVIYFSTSSSATPEVGDLRVTYKGLKSGFYSIVAKQVQLKKLEAFQAKNGEGLFLVEAGTKNLDFMIKSEMNRQSTLTWVLRGLGLLCMYLGLWMMLSPLTTILDVVPFLGNILGSGIGILLGLASVIMAGSTILVAKVFYNPIYILPVALVVGIGFFGLFKKKQVPVFNKLYGKVG